MSEVARLATVCDEILEQARDLVLKLDGDAFAAPLAGIASSAGAHLRHCLDAFDCLLDGLSAGRVDYDRRDRAPRTETEPNAALERIEALRERLVQEIAPAADVRLAVRADEPGLAPDQGWVATTLARELRALASHATHHYALVAVVLRVRGIATPARFGVAPSTWAYAKR